MPLEDISSDQNNISFESEVLVKNDFHKTENEKNENEILAVKASKSQSTKYFSIFSKGSSGSNVTVSITSPILPKRKMYPTDSTFQPSEKKSSHSKTIELKKNFFPTSKKTTTVRNRFA